ncbi:MAG: 4'-phosphopantetheinyl transferase superfamily protein [Alphaproteobacteria bacterium]|nr:4'-phosphopantetheinyl transferase superfamily protein [Alphaproteobacteria bacterium]
MKPFSVAYTSACHFGVIAAVHLPDDPAPVPDGVLGQLPEVERDHARTLGGYRQVSFVGGRLALHRAIRGLGRRAGPVLPGEGGQPQLPEGVAASISHKRTLAVALAARDTHGSVGVDLEDLGPARMGIADRVLVASERALVDQLPAQRQWTAVLLRFSLKEAIYKALYPYVNRYVGFEEAEVTPLRDCQADVALHLKEGEGPFLVEARYQWMDGHVMSTVRIRSGTPAPE